jgi:hypothetical protein
MKFITTLLLALAGVYLHAQNASSFSDASTPAIEIMTFDVSCSGKSNGSLYARSGEPAAENV